MTAFFLYLGFGAFAGVLAGLLGVGGGLVIVPIISYCLEFQGMQTEYTHHIALGTSLACIMFTSVSSFLAHHRNNAVIWDIVRQITLGILAGTFFGSCVAAYIPTFALRAFFILFLYYVATQMLLNKVPPASRQLPGFIGNSIAGVCIGLVSSLVGIGGGTLSVPYMSWCNIPMRKAIGTSAAIGFPIAVAGALGYMISGWNIPSLPAPHLGFIYLPALLGISLASVLTAPFGAKLAHQLPVPQLKRYFAILLYCMGTHMLVKLLRSGILIDI